MKTKFAVLFLACLVASHASAQTILGDSATEYSNVQGQNNWFYGYYDKTGDTASPGYALSDFVQMSQHQSGTWWVNNVDNLSSGFFTRLDALGGHSNGLDNYPGRLRSLREHFAVRRWISTYTGEAVIKITIAKRDIGGAGQGFILYKNALATYNPNQAFTSTTPQTFTFTRQLQTGDVLDLFLGWQAQDANGLTSLSMQVSTVPEPSSLIALGLGGIALRRRKALRVRP